MIYMYALPATPSPIKDKTTIIGRLNNINTKILIQKCKSYINYKQKAI